MKTSRAIICALFILAPQVALAHATPIELSPRSGAQLSQHPEIVSITFSEHLETGSSRIRVTDEQGIRADSEAAIVAPDGRTLEVPVRAPEGLYTVSWSVVSKDDGHFTRGSYAFAVGSSTVSATANEEVVQIATTKEAGLMFVEFLGNSLLWGVFALFLLARGDERLRRPFMWIAGVAAVCAAAGSFGQIVLKTHELADLHESGFLEALKLYLHTTAGTSTLIRGIALTLGGVIAAMFGFRDRRRTAMVLMPALIAFAYFRAIVSHATANPFHPTLSIAVNFIHVIEKDLWLGVLIVMCTLFVARSAVIRDHAYGAMNLLSANLAVLSASAGFIVWLHLRRFENLSSTAWGNAAAPLFAAALALIVIHIVVIGMLRLRPRLAERFFPALLGAEAVAAALVVFFTSIVIITSPPSTAPDPIVHAADSNGVRVELSRAPYEDGKALLTVSGSDHSPTVFIGDRDGGLLVPLTQRFRGGYVFPSGLIQKQETVSVIVPQEQSYNADVTFAVGPADFSRIPGHGRTMDFFTICIIVITLGGVGLSVLLTRYGAPLQGAMLPDRRSAVSILFGALVAYVLITTLCLGAARVFANRFESRCVYDGNMWHMMQPTKAGIPVAEGSQEGCMWGMGSFTYFFADEREYEYLSTLGDAQVSMISAPEKLVSGTATDLTFTLKNADGSPATLLVDMERYLHVVIVSEDQREFAHIHPDDFELLTQDAIDTSTFTVRHTFPKAGTYLVVADYAHGTQLASQWFKVEVGGSDPQSATIRTYPSPGVFSGYSVTMDHSGAYAGEVTTLKFNVTKGGKPVTDMKPYLSAVSHVSVVKNDLSAFVHTHGEVHLPGAPYPPVVVRNGKIIHSMSAMTPPASFGPSFEAHVLFPSEGRYTVWAQIYVGGSVIPTSFTVDVE